MLLQLNLLWLSNRRGFAFPFLVANTQRSDIVRLVTNLLVIQVFSCPDELAVKPYLGACRGQVVVDALEDGIDLPRKKCLIIETGANEFDPECAVGNGATLYLKPGW